MARAIDFAPISGQPSLRLRLASGYFTLTGVVSLALTALAVGWALSGNAELRTALRTHPLRPLGNALFAVGFLVAGHYLGKGSRRAAIVAVTVFCVPVLTALFGEATLGNAVIGGIGILIIFSIRDELT